VLTKIRTRLVYENTVHVHSILTKAKIKKIVEAKLHLMKYIVLQLEKMDNGCLQND